MSVQAIGWVLEESETTGNTRLVLASIANHAGARGENAWPSYDTIAHEARCSRATAIRAVAACEELGELLVYEGAGRSRSGGATNRYEMPHVPRWVAPDGIVPRNARGSQSDTPSHDATGSHPDAKGVANAGPTQLQKAPNPVALVTPKPYEPSIEPSANRPRVGATKSATSFDVFWHTYPRRTGKKAAQRAWAVVVRVVDPETIIAAAARFRDDPHREDQYTAHPTTWLNQGRWDDDPLPARGRDRGSRVGRDNETNDLLDRLAREFDSGGTNDDRSRSGRGSEISQSSVAEPGDNRGRGPVVDAVARRV